MDLCSGKSVLALLRVLPSFFSLTSAPTSAHRVTLGAPVEPSPGRVSASLHSHSEEARASARHIQMLCSSGVVKEGSGVFSPMSVYARWQALRAQHGAFWQHSCLFLDYPPRRLRDGLVLRLRAKLLAGGRRPNFVTCIRCRRASGPTLSRSVSDNAFGAAAADLLFCLSKVLCT